jgi:hypothetical protein
MQWLCDVYHCLSSRGICDERKEIIHPAQRFLYGMWRLCDELSDWGGYGKIGRWLCGRHY